MTMPPPLRSAGRRTASRRTVGRRSRNGRTLHIIPDDWPAAPDGLPTMFEDEGQEEMGDANLHTDGMNVLLYGIRAHLFGRPELAVLANMNFYYRPWPNKSYCSPDVMVVQPTRALPENIKSYRIGTRGPAPVLTIEVLSQRSYQQQD